LALDAQVIAVRKGDTRVIDLKDFFTGVNSTSLAGNEVIESVVVPVRPDAKAKMVKLGLRNGYSCSVSSAAVRLEMEGAKVSDIRIALGGVAPTPVRAYNSEKEFIGNELSRESVSSFADSVAEDISPITDVRGSAEYRMDIAKIQVRQAVLEAAGMEV
jgi:CO/xanthine dehydrogenase FAD-binding subunit